LNTSLARIPCASTISLIPASTIAEIRTHAYQALLDAIKDDESLAAKLLRKEYGAVIELNTGQKQDAPVDEVPGGPLRRRAIAVARQRAFELRRDNVIGDDAYRILVQELDWAELSAGGATA